jgi:hypothetical protein
MHRTVAVLVGLTAVMISVPAFAGAADEACFSAAADGQKLEKAARLLEARGRFNECARAECPAEVSTTCASFAKRVEDALPSLLVEVKDERGQDVTSGTVRVDGKVVPGLLGSTRALELNPGSHELRIESGKLSEVRTVLLREHDKGHRVTFSERSVASEKPAPAPNKRFPVAPVIVASIGVVGLGVFGTFAGLGVAQRSSKHCDAGCSQADYNSVQTKFLVADVALGVGVAALLTAGALWLFGGKSEVNKAAAMGDGLRF